MTLLILTLPLAVLLAPVPINPGDYPHEGDLQEVPIQPDLYISVAVIMWAPLLLAAGLVIMYHLGTERLARRLPRRHGPELIARAAALACAVGAAGVAILSRPDPVARPESVNVALERFVEDVAIASAVTLVCFFVVIPALLAVQAYRGRHSARVPARPLGPLLDLPVLGLAVSGLVLWPALHEIIVLDDPVPAGRIALFALCPLIIATGTARVAKMPGEVGHSPQATLAREDPA